MKEKNNIDSNIDLSGMTGFLKYLSSYMPTDENVITIEDDILMHQCKYDDAKLS